MPIGSIVSAVGGLIGGHYDREFSRAQSAADRAFQREVYQNQIQWKAADAKKAGLHPLAVIGGGAYSASPSSMPSSSSMASSLGKLGEGIGDAFTAYMNKDEIQAEKAKAAARDDRAARLDEANIRKVEAETNEAIARTQSYTKKMATGREAIPGQVDAPEVKDAYAVRPLGNGLYDINMSPDHQQELGDELGQIFNFIRKGTRERQRFWQHPSTKQWYEFDQNSGYWKIGDPESYKKARREYNSKKNQINRRFNMFSREPVYKYEDSWWWPF